MHITDYEKVKDLVWNNLFILDGGDEVGTKTIFANDLANALLKLADSRYAVGSLDLMNTESSEKLDKTARLLVGTSNGNKTIDLGEGFFTLLDAALPIEMRKNFFRGKNLGSIITNEQYSEIVNGTFRDMFIGDYWLINNVHWRIADINYWLGNGHTYTIQYNHLAILPDEYLADSKMNETNTTDGGYLGAIVYKEVIPKIDNDILKPIFGTHLVRYEDWLSNTVTNGIVRGGAWTNIIASLPTESMIIGSRHFTSMTSENTNVSALFTISHEQLSLLRLNGRFIQPRRYWYWLRDVTNAHSFVDIGRNGNVEYSDANTIHGIRPVFGIG